MIWLAVGIAGLALALLLGLAQIDVADYDALLVAALTCVAIALPLAMLSVMLMRRAVAVDSSKMSQPRWVWANGGAVVEGLADLLGLAALVAHFRVVPAIVFLGLALTVYLGVVFSV
jgi:hypothetical protein